MHPLVSIALVLSVALLWLGFTVVMLTRLNRAGRKALRQERKASRMKARPKVHADGAEETGRARRHLLKMWRRHPSAVPRRAWHG